MRLTLSVTYIKAVEGCSATNRQCVNRRKTCPAQAILTNIVIGGTWRKEAGVDPPPAPAVWGLAVEAWFIMTQCRASTVAMEEQKLGP